MKIPKSLASIQKVSTDKVSWHNIDKNIYDEEVIINYTFRLIGLPMFKWQKELITKHDFENEKSMNKVSGFKLNGTT
jgi:hypothetical protein